MNDPDATDLEELATAPTVGPVGAGLVIAGQFRLVRRIGRGGMGTVWLADQIEFDRPVVIKLMLEGEHTRTPVALERFRREAKAVAALNHPTIVQIYTSGHTETGIPFLAMEHVDGPTLRAALAEGPFPETRALRIALQISDALAEAHHSGIVHRDLKPENVMLTERPGRAEQVKVLDFGIARMVGRDGTPALTQAGAVFGTPKYMSPEQARGLPADVRADIYALGIMLYEMVTGSHPFQGFDAADFMRRHISEAVVPPSVRFPAIALSRPFESAILRCLEKAPDRRFQNAVALRECLDQCQPAGQRPPSPPPRQTIAGRNSRWPLFVAGGVASSAAIAAIVRIAAGTSESAPMTVRPPPALPGGTMAAIDRRPGSEMTRRERVEPETTARKWNAALIEPTDDPNGGPGLHEGARRTTLLAGALGLELGSDVPEDPEDDAVDGPNVQLDTFSTLGFDEDDIERETERVTQGILQAALGGAVQMAAPPDVMPGARELERNSMTITYGSSAALGEVIDWYDSRWAKKVNFRVIDQADGERRLILSAPIARAVPFLSLMVLRAPSEGPTLRTWIVVTLKPEA